MKQEELQSILPQLRPRLVALATRYLNDSDEAEDIVQDAMLKLWMLRKQLIGNVEGFAVVLVRNLALNRLRRLRRTHTLTEMELIELESMTDSDADRANVPSFACTILKEWTMTTSRSSQVCPLRHSDKPSVVRVVTSGCVSWPSQRLW